MLSAALSFDCEMVYGCEISKFNSEYQNDLFQSLSPKNRIWSENCDISDFKTLNPFTVVFSFCRGVNPPALISLVDLISKSKSVVFFITSDSKYSTNMPNFQLKSKIILKQPGVGGSSHTFYLYLRTDAIECRIVDWKTMTDSDFGLLLKSKLTSQAKQALSPCHFTS